MFSSYPVLSQLQARTLKFLCSHQQTLKSNITNQELILHLQIVREKQHQPQILQHVPLHNISPRLSEDQADKRESYLITYLYTHPPHQHTNNDIKGNKISRKRTV